MILELIATCHNIQYVNNQLVGHPLDLYPFEEIGWTLNENATRVRPPSGEEAKYAYYKNDSRIEILKKYDFEPQSIKTSVIVKDQQEKESYRYYVKGVPEFIKSLCVKESIPDNFDEYKHQVIQGWRVLACATKPISRESVAITRNKQELDSDLIFIGFIVMENNNIEAS
mmetsp:Transcript_7242/g.6516  ORF Transcript_7242/g.6516 Transcript_7242/m.6516 type:complete len:170 (+) Transcript_7242:1243-1752(+)|eukprot:CAMPEP_0114577050 /NCGR_PEP_ID=MMETSP0125-20121206/1754_1 /TAXON_ID=485358 ORGANISM="Aristerostoma sp., Strain ATCC 50986" /NCGR_SAMPLE_ID=MMETSP0125 /ASSEMBLY_ACC=CAM_ASM_000245 /LENGTH=169 /DNA_ID=CAMNT_0001766061 /DNA_START=2081 /DNA_END=2590 /DNA_ORIENTATION=+